MITKDNIPKWAEFYKLGTWKYRLLKTKSFIIYPKKCENWNISNLTNLFILGDKGETIASLEINTGIIHIYPGYCWDGATLAPDFPKVLRATLIHDLMCQLVNHEDWPYDRQDADDEFLHIAATDKFSLRWIYYLAVMFYGKLKYQLFPNKREKGISAVLLTRKK